MKDIKVDNQNPVLCFHENYTRMAIISHPEFPKIVTMTDLNEM